METLKMIIGYHKKSSMVEEQVKTKIEIEQNWVQWSLYNNINFKARFDVVKDQKEKLYI